MKLCRLSLFFVIAISMSACNIINYFKARHANDNNVPEWTSSNDVIALTTEYLGNKPQVIVSINGQTGYRMVIDTAASLSFLMDTERVKALALESEYELSLGGIGNEDRSPAFKSTLNTLSLGGVVFNDFSVAFMPVSTTPYYMVKEEAIVDGVIGHDVLRNFVWKFDRPENQVSLARSIDHFTRVNNYTKIDAEVSLKRFLVEGTINFGEGQTVTQDITIDTGSRNYLNVNGKHLKSNNIVLTNPSYKSADFGLSGMSIKQRTRVKHLHFGQTTFTDVRTNIDAKKDEDEMWYVGSALFRQYSTILDYPNEKMYLEEFDATKYYSRFNLIGLELRKLTNGNFIIKYVMPSRPAIKSGFEIGQEITSINGIASKLLSLEDWLQLSSEHGEYLMCVDTITACHLVKTSQNNESGFAD